MRLPIIIAICAAWLCSYVTAFAQTPKIQKANTPNWLLPSSIKPQVVDLDDISLGYYYESTIDQVHLGQQTSYYKEVKVITDDSGIEYAGQVNVNFDPTYQRLVFHEVQILRGNQVLDRLDISRFRVLATETDLSRFLYNGTYTAHLILDDLRKGDKIQIAYSLIGFNPVFGGKYSGEYYFPSGEPMGKAQVVYIVPDSRKLNIRRLNDVPVEKTKKQGGLTYIYWDFHPSVSAEYIPTAPSWFSQSGKLEISEFSTWQEVSDWATKVNPIPAIKAGSPLAKFVDEQWAKAKGKKETFLEYCLNFVQDEVRYMGIEMGEHSHLAHAPEKVFNQRYGDCKDKSLLLAAMLKYKNIKSSLVLANTYQDKELNKRLPSPYAFNHMVIRVDMEGHNKFLDPTISHQGSLPLDRFFPYYGEVLVLDEGNKLMEVPKPNGQEMIVEDIIHMISGDKVRLDVKTIHKGSQADEMRANLKQSSKNQLQKDYENYYEELYQDVKRIKPLAIQNDRKKNEITVMESYEIDDFFIQEEGSQRKMVPAYAKTIYDRLPQVDKKVIAPIAVPFPIKISHTVKVINKDNKPLSYFQEKINGSSDYYQLDHEVYTQGDTLISTNILEFYDSFLPADEALIYAKDYENSSTPLWYNFYLNDDGSLYVNTVLEGLNVNFWAFAYFFLIILLTMGFIYIKYNKSKPFLRNNDPSLPIYTEIGGWLIFVSIGVILAPFLSLFALFSHDSILMEKSWAAIEFQPNTNQLPLWLFQGFSLTFLAIALTFSVYLVIVFFQRRDIFPQTFIIFRISMLVFFIIHLLFSYKFKLDDQTNGSRFIGDMLVTLLIVAYIYFSNRSRGTFVVPYLKKESKF